jgi:hypothetical protein
MMVLYSPDISGEGGGVVLCYANKEAIIFMDRQIIYQGIQTFLLFIRKYKHCCSLSGDTNIYGN